MSRFTIYRPTEDDVAEAFRRSKNLGVLPSSLTRGAGNMTGFLAEIAFERTFPKAKYVGDSSYTHDYVLKGKTIDVKAKACTGRPMLHYNAMVLPKKDGSVPADIYFFARVHKNLTKVWLCGWATGKGVKKPKYWKKKGETDDFGFALYSDCYCLPYRATRRPDSL